VERIAKGLEHWCVRHHVEKVSELTGAIETNKKKALRS
jgi:dihydroorotate dehydrogenase (NAD+) catalytic subunit